MSRLSVLVVDDEKNIRHALRVCLEAMGVGRRRGGLGAGRAGGRRAAGVRPGVPRSAPRARRAGSTSSRSCSPRTPTSSSSSITAYATIETAVEAMRRGACDYLPKPFTPAQIRHVRRAGARSSASLTARVADLEERLQARRPDVDLEIAARRRCARRSRWSRRAAQADASVLLRGESGTGKGVLARAMHLAEQRRERPFVDVNCPTLSEELLASELFGHARGAFTGAVRDQPGRVEAAEGGTLFLDEIGELPAGLQAKLLRFLQEQAVRARRRDAHAQGRRARGRRHQPRPGGRRRRRAASARTCSTASTSSRCGCRRCASGPRTSCRWRGASSPSSRARSGARRPSCRRRPSRCCARYAWPGNVRELRNAIERAVILWPAPVHRAAGASRERIAGAPRARSRSVGGDFTLEEIEREHIAGVLARSRTLEEAAAHPRHRRLDAVAQAQALRRVTAGAADERQAQPEARPAAGAALRGQGATVRAGDAAADCQPQSGAGDLRLFRGRTSRTAARARPGEGRGRRRRHRPRQRPVRRGRRLRLVCRPACTWWRCRAGSRTPARAGEGRPRAAAGQPAARSSPRVRRAAARPAPAPHRRSAPAEPRPA